MANPYQVGETVICWRNVKDDDGNCVDPTTSMKISIYDQNNILKIDDVDMTPDETGKYHYDYNTSADATKGEYKVFYTATDGTRITIWVDTFEIE